MKKFKRISVKPYDKYKFEVIEPLSVNLDIIKFILPKGYTTDGASVPRLFWSLYPPYKPEWLTACVIHDFLCSRAIHADNISVAYNLADLALTEALYFLVVDDIPIFMFYHFCDKIHKIKGVFLWR